MAPLATSDTAATTAAEIIARFATAAPRYTSYPTAPHFHDDVDFTAVAQAWRAASGPLGVYVHVPFCARRCLYCGCHVQIARDRGLGTTYVDDLIRELDVMADTTDFHRPLRLVALGGGTPTWLAWPDLQRLVTAIRARTAPTTDSEWSIEVDPRSITADDAHRLVALGFNRVSLGVQDLDPQVLEAIGRPQPAEQVAAIAKAFGDVRLNFDLMIGLPRQTEASVVETVRRAVAMGPSRLSVFGYAHVPWMRAHQRGMERFGLPDDDARLRLTLAARATLIALGYAPIGLDHYARADDPLALALHGGTLGRNFMGYTDHGDVDLVGVGVSAIGCVGGAFAANERDLGRWQQRVRAGLPSWERGLLRSDDDTVRGWVIERLMCDLRVDKPTFSARFGRPFDATFADARVACAPYVEAGLLRDDDDSLAIDGDGWLVARNVAAAFDAYLGLGNARYSRTV